MNEPIDLDTLEVPDGNEIVEFLKRGGYASFGVGSDVDRLLELSVQIAELYVRNRVASHALKAAARRGLRGEVSWAQDQRNEEMMRFVVDLRSKVAIELWKLRGSMCEFMISE